jgi:hypothetical protein
MGLYTVLSVLFVVLVYREIDHGPGAEPAVEMGTIVPAGVA